MFWFCLSVPGLATFQNNNECIYVTELVENLDNVGSYCVITVRIIITIFTAKTRSVDHNYRSARVSSPDSFSVKYVNKCTLIYFEAVAIKFKKLNPYCKIKKFNQMMWLIVQNVLRQQFNSNDPNFSHAAQVLRFNSCWLFQLFLVISDWEFWGLWFTQQQITYLLR